MLALLLLAWLAAVPARAGIPILHQAHVGADPDHSHGCTHFSEIVSPSHGEVVSGRHFTLHVRCLAECGVGGAHVKIFLNEEFHPAPAVELFCEDRSATMKHIVITEPPPGLWTATIKTFRGSTQLDTTPFSLTFVIFDPPAPLDATTTLRSSPWEDSAEAQHVWGNAWGATLPHGYARCASGANGTVERCMLHNAMSANGSFFLWPGSGGEGAHRWQHVAQASVGPLQLREPSSEGFSLYACPGGQQSTCWGAAAALDVRYLMDESAWRGAGVCDTVVVGSSLVFSLPYLGSALSVYMAGIVAVVATLHDQDVLEEGTSSSGGGGLLIANAAPPVEASLGPYLALFATLTDRPVVSMTELSLQGSVCFRRLFLGTQHLLHLSSQHSSDAPRALDEAARWWETMQGGLRTYARRTRLLVARALKIDAALAARYRGDHRVFFAVRFGSLNRDWFDVGRLLLAAQTVKGVTALSGRFALTQDAEPSAYDWGPEWGPEPAPASHSPSAPVDSSSPRLLTLVHRLQNCSVLVGVTGEALASALWLPPGAVLLQVFPYGVKGKYGREYAVLAHASPGYYMEHQLPASAAHFYPWHPHPTATSDADLYWKQDPTGAELLYMRAGGLEVRDEELASLIQRAVSIVEARQVQRGRAPAADEQAGPEQSPVGNTLTFDAASFSLSWHSADGAVSLLPPRGQYG